MREERGPFSGSMRLESAICMTVCLLQPATFFVALTESRIDKESRELSLEFAFAGIDAAHGVAAVAVVLSGPARTCALAAP